MTPRYSQAGQPAGAEPAWTADRFLEYWGVPASQAGALPSSAKRFPDGAQYRIEIPSTEGTACLDAVLGAAREFGVPVHRVSQGSGVFMLTDAELARVADTAAAARVEVSLFARPNAAWVNSAMAASPAGLVAGSLARGREQLRQVLDDVVRAAEYGIRSVLIADIGVLAAFSAMRDKGIIPPDMQAKISVMMPAANPASARLLQDLGASTLNLPTDVDLADLAAIRAAVDIPIDLYVESPDNIGGLVRHHEIPEFVRIGAPVYLKFGLRNAPDLYPVGMHLESVATAMSRERVRRARLGLELLARSGYTPVISELGAAGLAVPSPGAMPGPAGGEAQ
jgi:Peptidase family U32